MANRNRGCAADGSYPATPAPETQQPPRTPPRAARNTSATLDTNPRETVPTRVKSLPQLVANAAIRRRLPLHMAAHTSLHTRRDLLRQHVTLRHRPMTLGASHTTLRRMPSMIEHHEIRHLIHPHPRRTS